MQIGHVLWLSVLAHPRWAVTACVPGILQELEALRGEASGDNGKTWASLKQLHQKELAAAEQRAEEAAAEVQRLAGVAASCRKEVYWVPLQNMPAILPVSITHDSLPCHQDGSKERLSREMTLRMDTVLVAVSAFM